MKTPSEHEIQRAFVMWFEGVPGKIEPAKRPGVVSWHTPNGGKREAFEAKRLKELGVLAGIPDYFMLWGGGLYAIEFKAPGGRLSAAQIDIQPRLLNAGLVACATVDNLEAAKMFCRQHLLTMRK